MTDKVKGVLAALAAVTALGVGGAAIAGATGSDSSSAPAASSEQSEADDSAEGKDTPINGSALDEASAAALRDTPGEVTRDRGWRRGELLRGRGCARRRQSGRRAARSPVQRRRLRGRRIGRVIRRDR